MATKIHRDTSGVFVIAATPFDETGALDLASTDRMLDFYSGLGVDGITILGVMGEAQKLAAEEASRFTQHVLTRLNGTLPVVVGITGAGLDPMARLAETAMAAGAAGVMIAPQANLATETKIRSYFAEITQALGPDTPIVYQDYPMGTGVQTSVETILALAAAHPEIVMLKHEDWPGLTKLSRVRAESRPRLSILTGNAGIFLPLELDRGADGAMTGFAFPEMMVEVVARHRAGDRDGAADLFDAYLPLVRYEQQLGIGLAIRKEILHRRGVLASPAVRAPGPKLTATDQAEITRLLERQDKRLKEIR